MTVAERTPSKPSLRPFAAQNTVSGVLARMLVELGVREAFGIVGGAIAPFCDVLSRIGRPRVYAVRHEAGAAFAACEASLATGRPSMVFTTTGPGLTNAITGVVAARSEGAKVIVVCGATSPAHRGRGAVQETSDQGFGIDDVKGSFDMAVTLESIREIQVVANRLAHGFARPGGFTALVALPLSQQRAPCAETVVVPPLRAFPLRTSPAIVAEVVDALREPFAIWAGFGARHAATQVRALAERTGARVLQTPRGKGIFPEDHPLACGVTGFGGHSSVEEVLERERPHRLLVLGSRLGEYSSVWDPRLVPERGFIHVDVDETAFGRGFPAAPTLAVRADVVSFLNDVLAALPASPPHAQPAPHAHISLVPRDGKVRPQALMASIQRVVLDGSDAIVMAEPGNSFAWTNHLLRFATPRYRMSGAWASMGHMVTGAVGAALAGDKSVVVVTGDGSMLMLSELSTAAQYRAPVVWVVLNDARFGITEAGMTAQGFVPVETRFPRCDFVQIARAVGADGVAVASEHDLDAALTLALQKKGPFVIDVDIDPAERAPFLRRIQALAAMGANRAEGP